MAALTRRALAGAGAALVLAPVAWAEDEIVLVETARLDDGLRLAYVERGAGPPVIFVHGSLSDYSYWDDQLPAFAGTRRAIAYSRRYNWPNRNTAGAGYSAVADALDLASMIELLCDGPAHVVGHSYGALAALILATRRPELIRTMVLAEPPAVSLLAHAPAPLAASGRAMLADIQTRMVAPMRAAFLKGEREAGVAAFIDYCAGDPQRWTKMSPQSRAEILKDAHEWDVMLTAGELFPEVAPEAVRAIRTPTLLLSGGRSYPFLAVIDETLATLLPNARRIVFETATHQMWLEQPEACRRATLELQNRA